MASMTASIVINLSRLDISKGLTFPNALTPQLAYLLGVLTGDGSINYRKKMNILFNV